MGALWNPDHERFCQAFHGRVIKGEPKAAARTTAYRETLYKGDNPGSPTVGDNARRLCHQKLIKARLQELADYAAKLAGIDASWALVQLAGRVKDYNVDDYLSARGAGERFFDLAACSREELGKLAEVSIEEDIIEAGEETMRKVRKIKIKPYDPASLIGLMAKIAGWLAPVKGELTGKDGVPLVPEYSDDDRARALELFMARRGHTIPPAG